jgi:hypothetical protein
MRTDLVYTNCVGAHFVPKEMPRLVEMLRANGVKYVVFIEPWWWGYKLKKDRPAISMKAYNWGHDYIGALEDNGFLVDKVERFYSKPEVDLIVITARSIAN